MGFQVAGKEVSLGIDLGKPHYPIYHATFTNDGTGIITAHYNGQVAKWSLDGKLKWVFDCKNKVKFGLSITEDDIISAFCENGDYYLIKDGKEVLHAIIDMDWNKSWHVLSAGKFAVLAYDKKVMFFLHDGKSGELEFKDKVRNIAYDEKNQRLVVAAEKITLMNLT